MRSDSIIVVILFLTFGLVSTFFLFHPRMKKHAVWAGSRAPMSLFSRICFCSFPLVNAVLALTGASAPFVLIPLFIFLLGFIGMIADRERQRNGLKKTP